MSKLLFKDLPRRDPSQLPADVAAVKAIVQAAVNVELFTIPLYMTSLYSLQGTHKINGANEFYLGRRWPGMSTSAAPGTPNQDAFNKIFGVFIAEMLHLQLASNLCKTVGVDPDFNSPLLQDDNYGWICYGPDHTVLPHILDFRDTIPPHNQIRVKLDALNADQVKLFLAVEETEAMAESIIREDKKDKYFPKVPFANWTAESTEVDLPMFGSIGAMYYCLWEYFSLQYSDGTTLWDNVFQPGSIQQDIFNIVTKGHPKIEYPGIHATVTDNESDKALLQVMNIINAITDQGEGSGVVPEIQKRLGLSVLKAVQHQFQPDEEALKKDYPSYTDKGDPAPSADAAARGGKNGAMDHYEIFGAVQELIEAGGIVTWDMWHAQGNSWTADDLKTADYDKNQYKQLPKAEDIANALNRLKKENTDKNFKQLSQAVAGAIAGITTVLYDYWQDPDGNFPYPSMSGSGDRMAICWAIFGRTPDLSFGIDPRTDGVLYHACQGMNLDPTQPNPDSCAGVEVYHTCRGSNDCHAQGGCGFVQPVTGGGGCSAKVNYAFYKAPEGNLCGGKPKPPAKLFSAPSDNKCSTLGGCAVPISASQMYPAPAEGDLPVMQLYDFTEQGGEWTSVPIGTMDYAEGDLVYDIAWTAYCKVLEHRGQTPPDKPEPSDFRLAFPPST